jgi:colicin import membrane protein
MSTVSKSRSAKPPKPEPDPYYYGWRYVRVVAPDGTENFEQVPLTLEDVLFPEVGDFIVEVESDAHNNDRDNLKLVFKSRLAHEPRAMVLSHGRVDWNLPGVRPLGPDIAVFFGVRRYEEWDTFDVAGERARPALVVEVTSPKTRRNDLGRKLTYYHQARVPLYLIADASRRGGKRRLKLIGYRYAPRGYQLIKPDQQGRIYLQPVRLSVGITQDPRGGFDRLACYDPETGQELGDYTAVVQALAESQAQTQAVKQQAGAAQRRASAAQRKARAEAQARVEAEARAAAAEARIRELEADLKRSRGQGR